MFVENVVGPPTQATGVAVGDGVGEGAEIGVGSSSAADFALVLAASKPLKSHAVVRPAVTNAAAKTEIKLRLKGMTSYRQKPGSP